MNRDLDALADEPFDVLVVGGGIVGVCIARDAALRGFRTALVERTDFGHGTSANCFKIVHGGLRYLQHLDFRRMRESIRERSSWLRIAPHLVEPLAFVVPTRRRGAERRLLLRAALAVNDLVAADRNRGIASDRRLPSGRSCTRAEAAALLPGRPDPDVTGAIVFYDAQMYSPERIVLEVAGAAGEAGARLANHVEFRRPLTRRGRLIGARVRDRIAEADFDVRARVVVNSAGPAAASIAAAITGRPTAVASRFSVALNLVLRRPGHPVAFATTGETDDPSAVVRTGGRRLLFMPWRGRQLVGTAHYGFDGSPAEFRPRERHVARFLAEVNRAWPGPPFTADDVALVHAGLLPSEPPAAADGGGVRLVTRHRIHDHAGDGVPGALSVTSVKFTTARRVAEEVVDRVGAKLGAPGTRCRTATTALPGARGDDWPALADRARRRHGDLLPPDVLDHLLRTYGADHERVLDHRAEFPDWDRRVLPSAPVIRAQLVHGARHEMAVTPDDLVLRRTEIGPCGLATDAARREAARVLRRESAAAPAS